MCINSNCNLMYQVLVEIIKGINRVYKIDVSKYLDELQSSFDEQKYSKLTISELIDDINKFNK